MDSMIRAIWASVTNHLSAGNISQALTMFSPGIRAYYQAVLTDVQPGLTTMFSNFPSIYPTRLTGEAAEYFVVLPNGGSNYGYYLYFGRDADGVWRLQGL